MSNTGSTVVVHKDPMTSGEVKLKWERTVEGEWEAWRVFDNPNWEPYRLYDLDAVDLTQVFATMQQLLNGDLPTVYLEPRESDIKRKLSLNHNHGLPTIEDWAKRKRADLH